MLLALMVISSDLDLLHRCTGHAFPARGRMAAAVRIVAAIPCSRYYLDGPLFHYIVFGALWMPIPFAVRQILWMRRHKAYWDIVRAREKAKRAEKRIPEAAQNTDDTERGAN